MMPIVDYKALYTIFVFLFGMPSQAMYTAATFTFLSIFLQMYDKFTKKQLDTDYIKSAIGIFLGYGAFLIIATRIDALAVDKVFGWQGSTQFLVCIYIIGRKAKEILIYIQSKGIPIPGVLAKRIEQMDDEKQITIDNRLSDIENKINQLNSNQTTNQSSNTSGP